MLTGTPGTTAAASDILARLANAVPVTDRIIPDPADS
jgi:hypothetical protein